MMTLGGVVISMQDCPEKIPLGGKLAYTAKPVSDGSLTFSVTGWTPNDISLAGTMRLSDAGGTPITRFERLEAIAQAGKPVDLIWTSDLGVRRTWTVTIVAIDWGIVRDDRVDYTIDCGREVSGGLVTAASAGPSQREQVQKHMKKLNSLRAGATAPTQTALDSAQDAYRRLPPLTL